MYPQLGTKYLATVEYVGGSMRSFQHAKVKTLLRVAFYLHLPVLYLYFWYLRSIEQFLSSAT